MNKTIILLCFLVLNGCAKNIHLTTQGYTDSKIFKITQLLKAHGFKVTQTNITIPKNYPSSVIATNPTHQKTSDILVLQSILAESNIEPATEFRFGKSRHFYHKGHIGLYLRHPQVNPNATMPPYIKSVSCAKGYASMAFLPNQQLILETEIKGQQNLHQERGNWSFDGNVLIVNIKNNKEVKFMQTNIMRETQFGPKPALLYSPMTRDHTNDILKCHFEIVFMD